MSLMHEVLDRSYLLVDMFESYIAEHPLVIDTPGLSIEADNVVQSLHDFYQLVGQYNAEHVLR